MLRVCMDGWMKSLCFTFQTKALEQYSPVALLFYSVQVVLAFVPVRLVKLLKCDHSKPFSRVFETVHESHCTKCRWPSLFVYLFGLFHATQQARNKKPEMRFCCFFRLLNGFAEILKQLT